MATRSDKFRETLLSLRTRAPEIIASALINRDGFIVASTVPREIDEEHVGGMTAALLGVGERIAKDLMSADMEQVYVKSAKGYVLVNSLDEDLAIVLLVSRDAKLGLIFLELKTVQQELVRSL